MSMLDLPTDAARRRRRTGACVLAATVMFVAGAAAGVATGGYVLPDIRERGWLFTRPAARAPEPVPALGGATTVAALPASPGRLPRVPAPPDPTYPAAAVTPPTEVPPAARALSDAFAAVARAVQPSVVRIDVEMGPRGKRRYRVYPEGVPPGFERFFEFGDPEGESSPRRGTGSGIIFNASGDIVTNRHVIRGASKLVVTLSDGREYRAQVVGQDARTDVAVIRLERAPRGLVMARIGDSDALQVGEWVMAIGSPLGLDQSVTAGIVSGKGRVGRRIHFAGDRVRGYIQTDAKINPGNSGGPLVNLSGEVVGLNTLINIGPGGSYGFAIPINEVRRVADVLARGGKIAYAYIGVLVGDVSDLDPSERQALGRGTPDKGALVAKVQKGGPGHRAGLQPGDVIVRVDGIEVTRAADVVDYVSSRPIGAHVRVDFMRRGRPGSVKVTLAELPSGGDDERLEEEEEGGGGDGSGHPGGGVEKMN